MFCGIALSLPGCERTNAPSSPALEEISRKPPAASSSAAKSAAAKSAAAETSAPEAQDAGAIEGGAPGALATAAGDTGRRRSVYDSAIRFEPLSDDIFPAIIPENGARHGYATILESLGSGGAATDIDQDGFPDVLIAGGGDLEAKRFSGRPIWYLRNRGQRFTDETANAGTGAAAHYNHGIAAADFDHDGFVDFLVTGYDGLQLFRNAGDGTFQDQTATSGLTIPTWSASAAWGDFNNDRNLDLYVTAYVNWSFENDPPCFATDGVRRDNCSPKLFEALPDRLFLSDGSGGFRDASDEFHVRSDGKALGVVVADLDLDGDVDAYVGNDVMMNFLYRNESGKEFSDTSISSGSGVSSRGSPDASMGVEAADYNLDGRPDLWAANFEMESFALYQNQGSMMFRHMSESTGISAIGEQYVGWGSSFADFDLDGDEDLCVCNGHVVQFPEHSPALQKMVLLENVEASYFEEVTDQVCEDMLQPRNGRGLAVIDWNQDGRPDLLTTPTLSPARLYTNTTSTNGQWLQLRMIGTQSPRHPVGAVVEVVTSQGTLHRQLKGGGSYASTSQPEVHIAIPDSVQIRELRIRWPGGAEQLVSLPEMNGVLTVIEQRAESVAR